jgi:hypothetical protein
VRSFDPFNRVIEALTYTGPISGAGANTHQLEREVRGASAVSVTLELQGQPTTEPLTLALSDIDGVLEVTASELDRGID